MRGLLGAGPGLRHRAGSAVPRRSEHRVPPSPARRVQQAAQRVHDLRVRRRMPTARRTARSSRSPRITRQPSILRSATDRLPRSDDGQTATTGLTRRAGTPLRFR